MYTQKLSDCTAKMCDSFPCIIVGDIKYPGINWLEGSAPHDVQNLLLETFITHGFEQFVTEPTGGEHIIDVVLFNQPTVAADVQVGIPFSNSDHSRVHSDIALRSCNDVFTEKALRKKYLWRQADYEGMQEYLSTIATLDGNSVHKPHCRSTVVGLL